MAYKKILFRRDTAANWTSGNPTLSAGEVGLESDTGKIKIGNGSSAWNSRDYFLGDLSEGSLEQLGDVTVSSIQNGDFLRWDSGSAVWHNDAISLDGDVVGNYVSRLVAGTGITLTNGEPTSGGSPTISVTDYANLITSTELETRLAQTSWHDPVYLATAAALPNSPTYTAGSADLDGGTGIGATLTATTYGQLEIDGVLATSGKRVLVKNQSSSVQNGIYTVTVQGSGGAYWVLTRATDMNGSVAGQIRYGEVVFNSVGTINGIQQFSTTSVGTGTNGAHIIGTDAITYSRISGVSAFTAGAGLATSENTLNVGTADSSRIVVNADSIDLSTVTVTNNSGAASAAFVSDITVDSYGRVTAVTRSASDIALGTNTSGNYVSSLVEGTGVTITNNSGEGATPTIAIGQQVGTTSNVTFNTVNANLVGNVSGSVQGNVTGNLTGDVTGNVTGNVQGNVTGDVTGNASTATKWASARTLSLTGDLSGSASIDGSDNVTLTATIGANSVSLGTDTVGDYVAALVDGTGVTITNNSGEGATPTIAIGQAVSTSSSVTFAQVTTTGNVVVGGNLQVSGSVVTVNQSSLSVDDPFIYLNGGSTITDPDLGIAGNYNDGTYAHAGFFSDASDSHKWKAFKGYVPEPTSPINTAHASYTPATIVGNTFESVVANGTAPLTVSSSTVVTNLNADLLDGQSGAYYAPINNASFTGTFSAPTGTITSAMIADGTIVNGDISSTAAIDLGKIADPSTNQQTASYVLVLGDKNKIVEMNVGSGNTLTVPPNSSVAYAIGSQINILQVGSGQTTITPGSGVTINGTPGLKTRAQWSYVTLIKRGTDTWVAVGDLSA